MVSPEWSMEGARCVPRGTRLTMFAFKSNFYMGEDDLKWSHTQLPTEHQNWLDGKKHSIRLRTAGYKKTRQSIDHLASNISWQWPKREIIFISDLHADPDCLLYSLVASGGVKLTGRKKRQIKLTDKGRKSLFLFGGDFFDKGPSNLQLLDGLYQLIQTGARVRLLAGNHDIRVLFGMRSIDNTDDPRNGHFFVRMGAKSFPFLSEIRDQYFQEKHAFANIPSEKECLKRILPSEIWYREFRSYANWVMPEITINREIEKIEKKAQRFEDYCSKYSISAREAYAAALKWQTLFLAESGSYSWFFQKMRLAFRKGSFLFVHAGLDDRVAALISQHGVNYLNKSFKRQLSSSPFEFYYGPIANTIRTKYRPVDMPLTLKGTRLVRDSGIHAIVQGHRNLLNGQRIALRKQLLHFECDITLDRNSRRREGLTGIGGGATLIQPTGQVVGISCDHHKIKVFKP